MRKMITALVASFAALALSACSSFHFDSQEIGLAHDLEEDVLEVELVYRNIRPRGDQDDELEDYEKALLRIKASERFFLPPPLFWDQDLEEVQAKLEAAGPQLDESQCQLLEFVRGISVVEVRLFEDEAGHSCLVQRLRVPHFAEGLRLWNERLRQGVVEDVDAGRFGQDVPGLDERTLELWAEEARHGKDWVRWSAPILIVEIPLTPASAAAGLPALIELTADDESGVMLPSLLGAARALTAIELRDDHLRLEFAPGEDGRLHFDLTGLEWRD